MAEDMQPHQLSVPLRRHLWKQYLLYQLLKGNTASRKVYDDNCRFSCSSPKPCKALKQKKKKKSVSERAALNEASSQYYSLSSK